MLYIVYIYINLGPISLIDLEEGCDLTTKLDQVIYALISTISKGMSSFGIFINSLTLLKNKNKNKKKIQLDSLALNSGGSKSTQVQLLMYRIQLIFRKVKVRWLAGLRRETGLSETKSFLASSQGSFYGKSASPKRIRGFGRSLIQKDKRDRVG